MRERYRSSVKTTRAERREQTRQAVETRIANGETRHSVQQLVQRGFEMHGGTGDAGARVL